MDKQVIYPPLPPQEKSPPRRASGKPKSRRTTKTPVRLDDRLLAVMETIAQHGGGPVSTAQLAALYWPPDLPRALAWWGLDPATVAALLDQYPAAHIGQRLELAKFLSKLARIVSNV